jgi:hypothetical protein
VIALAGENGSGKTTLAKLICGLYAPDRGTVAWDRVDTATVDPDQLRDAAEFIERWPEAYEAMLGPIFAGGKDLSTGQWQRIALARAFFPRRAADHPRRADGLPRRPSRGRALQLPGRRLPRRRGPRLGPRFRPRTGAEGSARRGGCEGGDGYCRRPAGRSAGPGGEPDRRYSPIVQRRRRRAGYARRRGNSV